MREKKQNPIKELLGWVITIAVAVGAAYLINTYVIMKAKVPTGSMENTIQIEDRLIGLKMAYVFSEPERGDIVIFPFPDNPEKTYVKRLIGMPGETITISNGKVYVDGVALQEDYLKEEMKGTFGPYEVPDGCYFMLGDNRNSSEDSRYWKNTYLKREDIIAKVLFRYSPNFTWFKEVSYE